MGNSDLLKLSEKDLLDEIPKSKKSEMVAFIKELNRREYLVRFQKSCTFDTFQHIPGTESQFKNGFIVDGKSVPYFHPNRSFHDEIIWLNENLFYNSEVTFEDRIINAAIVKFYGPSNTLKLAVEGTEKPYVIYEKFIKDPSYQLKLCSNIENAVKNKQKIYGTTELRTSLQVAARNYARKTLSPIDKIEKINSSSLLTRKTRPSDILYWFTHLGPLIVDFYRTKPNMEESFKFLTGFHGIGNYYGYHFSCNLARMPEVGNLIFSGDAGNIDEDDVFVIPGVGAMDTINWFFEHKGFSVNTDVGRKLINSIRNNQSDFFELSHNDSSDLYMKEVSELGQFTNFGCEISCCQFGVYRRIREDKKLANKRASAPISKEEVRMIINRNRQSESHNEILDLMNSENQEKNEMKNIDVFDHSSAGLNSLGLSTDFLSFKEKVILETFSYNTFPLTHDQVLKDIKRREMQHLFEIDSNWKETWKIMGDLVKKQILRKEGRKYSLCVTND